MSQPDPPAGPREARASDESILDIIRRQAIEDRFSDHYDRSRFADLVARIDPSLGEWIQSPRVHVLVIETSITPICYGAYDREQSRIRALYTSPDYQGRGCGSRMLEELLAKARQAGAGRVSVWVPRPTLDFFQAREFKVVEATERYGLEGAEMVRRITG